MEKESWHYLGLGTMGGGMAANLLKAGFSLAVYNRTLAKAEVFAVAKRTSCKDARGRGQTERRSFSPCWRTILHRERLGWDKMVRSRQLRRGPCSSNAARSARPGLRNWLG